MGLTAAILLAQRGYLVHVGRIAILVATTTTVDQFRGSAVSAQVYDKREDPRLENGLAASRTIFWGIGLRGQSAMTAVSCCTI